MSRPSAFTYAFAKDKGMLVLTERESLTVGVREGADAMALVEARRALGQVFQLEALSPAAFDRELSAAYSSGLLDGGEAEASLDGREDLASLVDGIPKKADLLDGDDDAPIIRLINGLINEAVKRRASDIHFDPFEDVLSIRYRIDGDLTEVLTPSRRLAAPIVSRIKVMARLDISEKRLPQDGRISLTVGGRAIDVRVATLPTNYGERVTMRLLDQSNAMLDLSELGMDPDTYERFADVLARPNGVILVTGPVGSGKTTTLYSALSRLKTGNVNIMTLEDPVEYSLKGISQTQMDPKVGLTFAAGLRSVLRHDFNIAMIGEIRDRETAEAAFEFASLGRLALSTLHTNSSAGAVIRLRDMGVESYQIAANVRAIMAQRLVRKLCDVCKEGAPPTDIELRELGLSRADVPILYQPRGCMACNNTGYQGRLGIYELLVIDKTIAGLIHSDATEGEIERTAFVDHDMLFDNAKRYILAGETSLAEVLRVSRKESAG